MTDDIDCTNGTMVSYGEYAKLRAELAAARALLDEAVEWLPLRFDEELEELIDRINAMVKGGRRE